MFAFKSVAWNNDAYILRKTNVELVSLFQRVTQNRFLNKRGVFHVLVWDRSRQSLCLIYLKYFFASYILYCHIFWWKM